MKSLTGFHIWVVLKTEKISLKIAYKMTGDMAFVIAPPIYSLYFIICTTEQKKFWNIYNVFIYFIVKRMFLKWKRLECSGYWIIIKVLRMFKCHDCNK